MEDGNGTYTDNLERKGKYKLEILICFLDIIPIIKIKLDDRKVEKLRNNKKIKKINLKKIKRKLENKNLTKNDIIQLLKIMKPRIEKFRLSLYIGLEDVSITSYAVAILSIIIGMLLPKLLSTKIKSCNYMIRPVYKNQNVYQVSANCIFSIKIVHIIYSMSILMKKGRNEENNERTSDRGNYAYYYE